MPEPDGSHSNHDRLATAITITVTVTLALALALAIAIVAAFSTWGDRSHETPAFAVFAPLAAIVGVGLYVLSGRVAARIAQDRRGWLMLVVGPLILVALRITAALLVS